MLTDVISDPKLEGQECHSGFTSSRDRHVFITDCRIFAHGNVVVYNSIIFIPSFVKIGGLIHMLIWAKVQSVVM
jgi:hypothetical protein